MLKKFKMLLMMLFVCLFSVGIVNADLLSPGKSYTLTPSLNTGYTDPTLSKLTNSNLTWGDSVRWSGIYPVIVLDLGASYTLQSVSMYAMQSEGENIYYPSSVDVELSEDGVNFVSVGSIVSSASFGSYCFKGTRSFVDTVARYVRYSPSGGGNAYIIEIEAEGFSLSPPATPTSLPPTPTPTQQATPIQQPSPTPTQQATPTPTVTPSTGSTTSSFGGVVYGRVVDKFKSPLPEIKVEYSTLGDEYLGKNPVLTDNDGYYYFEDVDTQFGYGLVMTGKRYGTVTLSYDGTVKDSVVRVPDKMLVRGNSQLFTLSGTVKDLYSSPVEHARVRVKSSGEPHIVYTDSLGAFSVSDLFVGTYTVTVKHSGYYPGRVKYSNVDGLDGSIEVSLQER